MIKKLATWLMFGLLCLVWLSANSFEFDTAHPSADSTEQTIEMKAVALQFYALRCFQDLRDTNKSSELPPTLEDFAQIEIPSRVGAHDDFQYEVLVHRREHTAYLLRVGGLAGVQEVHGPIPFDGCIKQAVERTAASNASH